MAGLSRFIELILMNLSKPTVTEVCNDVPFQHHRDFMSG